MDVGTVLTVWYFFFYWNCPDSVKYHTVSPFPTSMKNNKIPHCRDSSNRKTRKYHTVRTVPTFMKNNKIPGILLFFYYNCPDSVVFCCFSWMLEMG
jgi:hypothetical protein